MTKQEVGEVDHEHSQISGIVNRSLLEVHKIFQAPELFGIAEIELNGTITNDKFCLSRRAELQPIRYYESIGLIPSPQRAENNYRQYTREDAEKLRFIASARSLGFSLDDITEFLGARDDGLLPCQRMLDSLDGHLTDIDRRIADLLALRESLIAIRQAAQALPQDKAGDEQCVCYLL